MKFIINQTFENQNAVISIVSFQCEMIEVYIQPINNDDNETLLFLAEDLEEMILEEAFVQIEA